MVKNLKILKQNGDKEKMVATAKFRGPSSSDPKVFFGQKMKGRKRK